MADIVGQECSQNCSTFPHLKEERIPKSTLSQHFRILREAGLIRGERRGVKMHKTSRCAEIDARYPGLIAAIVKAHNIQRGDEARAAKKSKKSREKLKWRSSYAEPYVWKLRVRRNISRETASL